MRLRALILSLVLSLLCVPTHAVTPGGAAIGTQFTSLSIGDATVCTASVTAGLLKFRKIGNVVTVWWAPPYLLCTLSVAANGFTFAQQVPAGFRPAQGAGCTMVFGTSTSIAIGTAYSVHIQFQGNGNIVVQTIPGSVTQTVFNSTNSGDSCSYAVKD